MKVQIGKTYYYPEFISEEEKQIVEEWALRNEKFLVPNRSGPARARALFSEIREKLDLLMDFKKRLIEIQELDGKISEAVREDFLSIQRNGGQVPIHIDSNPSDETFFTRRYNIFVSLPESGGLPIYDGEILDLKERCLLKVDSGLIPHGTTKIEGEKPRILLSYGFAVKKQYSQ